MEFTSSSGSHPVFPFEIDCKNHHREYLDGALKHVAKNIVEDWKNENENNICISRLCGGITNVLYLLRRSEDPSDALIVRVYGEGTSTIIDRDRENSIFANLRRFDYPSPSFYGLFTNGRIEGYFHNTRSLDPFEMYHDDIFLRIADNVSRFHRVDLSSVIPSNIMLWDKISGFFAILDEIYDRDSVSKEKMDKIGYGLMKNEYQAMKSNLETLVHSVLDKDSSSLSFRELGRRFAVEKVFCHNDLLSGNILIDTEKIHVTTLDSSHYDHLARYSVSLAVDSEELTGVSLIDYEYSGYNYRIYDIANHFCEYCGFDFDIFNLFPGFAQRRRFLASYILSSMKYGCTSEALLESIQRGMKLPTWAIDQQNPMHEIILSFPLFSSSESPVDHQDSLKEFIQGMDEILCQFLLPSHLFWGTWALVNSFCSMIDFDYYDYCQRRYDGYFYHKKRYFEHLESCSQY